MKEDSARPLLLVKKIIPLIGKSEAELPPKANRKTFSQGARGDVKGKAQDKGKRKLTAEEVATQEKEKKQ